MSDFPRTTVGGVSLPRLVIGTNWFLGFSHTSHAKDKFIKTEVTADKVADIVEVFLRAGVDAVLGFSQNDKLQTALKIAEDRVGREVIIISTPTLKLDGTDEAEAENARILDAEVAHRARFCMPHQSTTDALVDRTTRTIRRMDRYAAMIRERGMVPGLSTHMPEAPVYADETGLDVETYIQMYNAIGFLMQVEVEWVHRIIREAKKPVITIKPMAAGRLSPLPGLAFAWSTIREQDMVTVGTMTADEAKELIELSLSLLEKREADVELQRTRSKESVERKSEKDGGKTGGKGRGDRRDR